MRYEPGWLPEPFASFPALTQTPHPKGCAGVPGLHFARDARLSAIQVTLNAPLLSPTPLFTYPWPPLCRTPYGERIILGSPEHTLACAQWAFGWCEGTLHAVRHALDDRRMRDAGLQAKRAVERHRGILSGPNALVPPKWRDWFAEYARAGFIAPQCYWPH